MIWPIKPSPQSIMGIMGLFLIGCVSIKTHEQSKIESYQAGERDMAMRVIKSLKNGESTDEMMFNLKGILEQK